MDNWSELARTSVIRPPVNPLAQIPLVTCSVFQVQQDIIWVGDTSGYVAAYAENVLSPYTRFATHSKAVRQVLPHQKGVLSTDGDSIRLTNLQGITEFTVGEKDFPLLKDIKKIAYISSFEVLVVTGTDLLRYDLNKNTIKSIMLYNGNPKLIASGKRHVALGNENGSIDIFDHIDEKFVKTFNSHSASLSDMDLQEHRLVVCGVSKHRGSLIPDPMVQVYDLRSLSVLPPISFPAGAAFVRLHPKLSTFAMISSSTGQIQITDMSKPTNFSLYQVDSCPSVLSFELSSTGDYLSIIDGYSVLHLWCHSPEHSRMSLGNSIVYPDPETSLPLETNIDNLDIPLSSVGLPYYKDQLLSNWPNHIIFQSAGIPSARIDPEIYKNAENVGGITVAPYDKDKYGRRNQAKKYVPISHDSEPKQFLSSKKSKKDNVKNKTSIFEYKTDSNNPPSAYKKLEIFYSKFGVDDFDFDSYNHTEYSGLESHVDNSYTNSLLQLYRFVPQIHQFLLSSLAAEDFEPNSLTRELGYLYDMLDKSHGKNFRPTNFQYALSNIKEAAELGLIEKEAELHHSKYRNTLQKLQSFNRFLLDRIQKDQFRMGVDNSFPIYFEQICGIQFETSLRSMYGNVIRSDVHISLTLEVPLLRSSNHPNARVSQSVISHIEAALNRSEEKPVMNERTGSYEMINKTQVATVLPPVLAINLHLTNEDKKSIRNIKDWLKPKFQAGLSKQGFILTDTVRDSNKPESNSDSSRFFKIYELSGFVAEISGENEKDKHLVTFVNIQKSSHEKQWYLFNDFLVFEIPESEVLNFSCWWKTPVSLIYRDSSYPVHFETEKWKMSLNDEILYRDHFACAIRESTKLAYELLTKEEAPKPGSLIAIDTEFVIIEQEQFEVKSNGQRLLLKPSTHALARVSILRGDDGEKFGVPFIDDYVVVKEQVQDYLTSYSGIEPGDLDPETSNKPLVTREVAYRKIWLLLNLGCVFVGHGLTKDFRTINICVPKNQIRDTSVFFYKGQRILSLRFLAYILLRKEVQVGNHDSIEDALTALLIYKEYLRIKAEGLLEGTLDFIYSAGKQLKFKPPSEQDAS